MNLQKLLEDAGYSCDSYSGRHMYGKECLSVTTDESLPEFIANILDNLEEPLDESLWCLSQDLRKMKSDSMGHDMVYYFPSIEFDNDKDPDAELNDLEEEDD